MDLEGLREKLSASSSLRPLGRVSGVTGLLVRLSVAGARVGDVVTIRRRGEPLLAEVVGLAAGEALAVPLGELSGVGVDDEVENHGEALSIASGTGLLGRVLDGLGRPLDGRPLPDGLRPMPVDRAPPSALTRRAVSEPLPTGVRVLDGLLTLGVGQRVGLFAGSGVGKSTLLGAMARGTSADVVVVALVGERGREVGEFLRDSLGAEGLEKAVVVVATSDAPPVERLRAAQVATAIAEGFRDDGKRVLLLVDSVTRVARAQREIGLAVGEPPARRGYPPSVFTLLPRLLERSGQGETGSITAVYTVLVEGGDMDEPIADEVRGVLDGHIVLSRDLAARGIYPAVDVPVSISRVMDAVVSNEQALAARELRAALGAYAQRRDLVALGAYAKGSDPKLDAALSIMPELERFLLQDPKQPEGFERTKSEV
ncbi:MAG TPA: FliI/YscN family ATPase, partial [Polyangiaceae bacterium]|nr:FliI/YscN family ATPase [Polyangiaceae bacterium]